MSTTCPPRATHCRRRGFSIVEVIVAMMIVTIGLLGIAGSTTLALRATLDAARRREAAERAQSRVAQLAAAGCSRATSGQATDATRQLTEEWSVKTLGAYQQVTDSLAWATARGRGHFSLSTAVPC